MDLIQKLIICTCLHRCNIILFFITSLFSVSLQETVGGFFGGSAVLPCSSEEPLHTIQDIHVHERHSGQNVYDIINGNGSVGGQDPQYKNRAESFPEEYLRGNFSIKLNNLQHTDAGVYWCYIIMKESDDQIVELLIKSDSPCILCTDIMKACTHFLVFPPTFVILLNKTKTRDDLTDMWGRV
uniref:Immunoglobulin V-set domain-containing protein n=1 Tax=Cyprinus carpio TaxID=7962 RepID=A0A8C2FU18_CYPCA